MIASRLYLLKVQHQHSNNWLLKCYREYILLTSLQSPPSHNPTSYRNRALGSSPANDMPCLNDLPVVQTLTYDVCVKVKGNARGSPQTQLSVVHIITPQLIRLIRAVVSAMAAKIKKYYWWPTVAADCKAEYDHCHKCKRTKHRTAKHYGNMQRMLSPMEPGVSYGIHVDFLTNLPPSFWLSAYIILFPFNLFHSCIVRALEILVVS